MSIYVRLCQLSGLAYSVRAYGPKDNVSPTEQTILLIKGGKEVEWWCWSESVLTQNCMWVFACVLRYGHMAGISQL